ncbi:Hypothetical predicted protein [Mytilus galloprovincialis]|uniref:Uncharacterized protein n=1 Tax=Mytilus galloprovincialis TaxID=29158 RepID=A0A8B6G2G0_MYTGA|nr:Hypothetical predicted protein [Mytilus galloprovincialis]
MLPTCYQLCVEKDTMWADIAGGGSGNPGKGEAQSQNVKAVLLKDKLYIDNDVFDPLKHEQFIKESTVAFPSGASSGNSKTKGAVGSNDNDPDPNSSMNAKED